MVRIKDELWTSLPTELWNEILLRLSIKDVLKCKAISKFFLLIIDDPEFAILHFPLHAADPPPEGGGYDHINDGVGCQNCKNPDHQCYHVARTNLIVIDRPTNDGVIKGALYVTKFGDILTPTNIKFEFRGNWGPFKCDVVGSLMGLVLLHKYKSRRKNWNSRTELILWNPLTGKTFTIPKSPFCLKGDYFVNQPVKLGFGYDANNDDYKIVVVVLSSVPEEPNKSEKPEYTATIEVYSLRTMSWSTRRFSLECGLYLGPKINHNGSIIWLAGEFSPNGIGNVDGKDECEGDNLDDHEEDVNFSRMISFDLGVEELHTQNLSISENEERKSVKFPVSYYRETKDMRIIGNETLGLFDIGDDKTTLLWELEDNNNWQLEYEYLVREELYEALVGWRVSNAIVLYDGILVSLYGRGLLSYIVDHGDLLTDHLSADFMGFYEQSLLSPSNPFGI